MKTVVILCLVTAAFTVPLIDEQLNELWELYKSTYNKTYSSQELETLRRLIWEGHVSYISKHNREYDLGIHTYTVGLNEYADMSNEEFTSMLTGYQDGQLNGSGSTFLMPSNVELPSFVDWRRKGYVTPVKNQGQCNSCWAFAATGALEGQHFKLTGRLVSLSEQNLMDCSRAEGNFGCEGGRMDYAFDYIKTNGGIDTEASYPYEEEDSWCRYDPADRGASVTGFVYIRPGDEQAMKAAVATIGPISSAVDARHVSFQLYKSGLYNPRRCSWRRPNHALLIVGYGVDGKNDYWLVKNSWGTTWGQKGYAWVPRNKNNKCGIATTPIYPLV